MTDPNDTAFPVTGEVFLHSISGVCIRGLTKREHFAAMAMQALLCGRYASGQADLIMVSGLLVMKEAVAAADILIEELNKEVAK